MTDGKRNSQNPFTGLVSTMWDVVNSPGYPGYSLEGDAWTPQEREALDQFCQERFDETIRIRSAQFVIAKRPFADEKSFYSAYRRSWESGHIIARDFEELMGQLHEYMPEPIRNPQRDGNDLNPADPS